MTLHFEIVLERVLATLRAGVLCLGAARSLLNQQPGALNMFEIAVLALLFFILCSLQD